MFEDKQAKSSCWWGLRVLKMFPTVSSHVSGEVGFRGESAWTSQCCVGHTFITCASEKEAGWNQQGLHTEGCGCLLRIQAACPSFAFKWRFCKTYQVWKDNCTWSFDQWTYLHGRPCTWWVTFLGCVGSMWSGCVFACMCVWGVERTSTPHYTCIVFPSHRFTHIHLHTWRSWKVPFSRCQKQSGFHRESWAAAELIVGPIPMALRVSN